MVSSWCEKVIYQKNRVCFFFSSLSLTRDLFFSLCMLFKNVFVSWLFVSECAFKWVGLGLYNVRMLI